MIYDIWWYMSLRILYVYFVNLYICNTYTFGFVLIRTCVFPIPCHTHTYIYNTRLNKRLNPYAGAMHLGASLNLAASTASCVSSQAASFDPGFTLGSGGKGWGKVATILHPKCFKIHHMPSQHLGSRLFWSAGACCFYWTHLQGPHGEKLPSPCRGPIWKLYPSSRRTQRLVFSSGCILSSHLQ